MAYRHSAAAIDLIKASNARTNASRAAKVRAFQLGRPKPKSEEWKRKIAEGVSAYWARRRINGDC